MRFPPIHTGRLNIKRLFRQEAEGFGMRTAASVCPRALVPITAGVLGKREEPYRQSVKKMQRYFCCSFQLENKKITRRFVRCLQRAPSHTFFSPVSSFSFNKCFCIFFGTLLLKWCMLVTLSFVLGFLKQTTL